MIDSRRELGSRLLLLVVVFEHVVEELQDELLLFLWQAFYFLKLSFELRDGSRFLFLRLRIVVADEI